MTTHTCPPDHKHGATSTCRTIHRCRCDHCRAAEANRATHRRRQKAYGRVYRVPATGTRRRIQALYTVGWSTVKIGEQLGCNQVTIQRWLTGGQAWVTKETHDKVADLYERLWNQQPPSDTVEDRISIGRALAYARTQGFHPPLAWDDIDTDAAPPVPEDVDAVDEMAVAAAVDGLKPKLTHAERVEVVRILNSRGLSDAEIAPFVGVHPRSVIRIRQFGGIAAALTLRAA